MSKPTHVEILDKEIVVWNGSLGPEWRWRWANDHASSMKTPTNYSPSSALQALEEENERLREGIKRLSEEEEICGETMSEEDAFDLVRMAAKLAEYEKANVAYVDANTALIARATATEARLKEALKVIEPFAKAFEKARTTYSKRYSDITLGETNFDKMPDSWSMDTLTFNMGQFRAASRFMEESR